ncbi:COG1361 S-layer family protein [Defluviitalea phaphyphila]|uniref:COG1361 S-layer family protein n=1 Tax=Defluviitalea phaphyphila TaxID=1473580 RepID=UPI00073029C2|nr:CARDB domain-containing protein [Defluviitalea phaphyphila]
MKRINKYFISLFIFVFCFSFIPSHFVYGDDVELSTWIKTVYISGNELDAGDTLTVEIMVKMSSNSEKSVRLQSIEFSDGYKNLGSSSLGFDLTPGSYDGDDNPLIIRKLEYTGGGSRNISYTIEYVELTEDGKATNKTGTITGSKSIDDSITVVDTKKYQPRISLVNDEVIEIGAGEYKEVSLPFINAGGFTAKGVTITIDTNKEETQIPILIKNVEKLYFSSINRNAINYLNFGIEVDRTAEPGLYPITLKYKYTNASDDEFEGEDTIYVKVLNTQMPARLKFGINNPEPLTPGNSSVLNLEVTNQGESTASNIEIALTGLNKDGITVVDESNISFIPSISPGETITTQFKIMASGILEGSVEPITIEYTYADGTTEKQEGSQQIFIPLDGKTLGLSELTIENITSPSDSVKIGEDFNIGFTLVNNSEYNAKSVKITLDGGDILKPKSQNIYAFKDFNAGDKKQFSCTFWASSDAEYRNYPIEIKVEYIPYQDGDIVTFSQYVGINVDGSKSDDTKSKPRVIIGEYSVEPQIVRAGEEFYLSLGFTNTHSSKVVQNMKATLTINEKVSDSSGEDAGTVFTPVSGQSNMFYISEIQPTTTITRNVRMYTVPDATPKTYEVTVEMEYEDSNGESYTETAKIGIPVQQRTQIDIGEVRIDGEAIVGEPAYVVSQIFNTGRTNIKNLMVTVEGDFEKQEANLFVGNFQQGNEEYFEGVIIPTQSGECSGELVVTYEEITGEQREERIPFTMNVMEAPMIEDINMGVDGMDMMPPEMEEVKKPFYKKPVVISGILASLVLIAAIIIIIRKRKKRNEIDIDE